MTTIYEIPASMRPGVAEAILRLAQDSRIIILFARALPIYCKLRVIADGSLVCRRKTEPGSRQTVQGSLLRGPVGVVLSILMQRRAAKFNELPNSLGYGLLTLESQIEVC